MKLGTTMSPRAPHTRAAAWRPLCLDVQAPLRPQGRWDARMHVPHPHARPKSHEGSHFTTRRAPALQRSCPATPHGRPTVSRAHRCWVSSSTLTSFTVKAWSPSPTPSAIKNPPHSSRARKVFHRADIAAAPSGSLLRSLPGPPNP
jgi:hypothetical protein